MNRKLEQWCEKTGAHKEGIENLLNYYEKRCGWSTEQAHKYVEKLFKDGTMQVVLGLAAPETLFEGKEKSVDEDRLWHDGALKVYGSNFRYWIKQYEEKSKYGIDGGRVSKLMLKRDNKVVCNYDRGWDVEPSDPDTQLALEILLHEYN